MLEILSHQYLKKFMRSKTIDWDHIYSFGRIISKCIQNESTYLINSEIFFTKDWVFPTLIPLFLNEENSTLILTAEKIEFLKSTQLKELKNLGLTFYLENDQIIFPNHKINLITLKNLLNNDNYLKLKNHRFILSGIEDLKQNLKNHFRLILSRKDWITKYKNSDPFNKKVFSTYNSLKKRFFLRKSLGNNYLVLDKNEVNFLSEFFHENSSFSEKFLKVSNALLEGWACWVRLDNKNFEWNFYLEPIDELSQVKELLIENRFVYLSALRRDYFLHKYLKKQSLDIDLVINFKSNFTEKKIQLYVPPKQLLPNNPFFTEVILDKCKKLIIFRSSSTLVLCDDIDLKTTLATELASKHGKRVLLESMPSHNNEIICSSFDWWIQNSSHMQIPGQIIVPLLPIPNMSEPINIITVSHNKKLSRDWFREFLLPEALVKLERSISPLRKNAGKLIILDGRVNQRKWGRSLLQSIQPSKEINYVLPFD